MNNYVFVITLCLFILVVSNNRLLSEEEVQGQVKYYYRHMISIHIGTPYQELRMKLSSSVCGIWLHNKKYFNKGFDTEISTTFQSTNEEASMEDVQGIIIYEHIKLFSIVVEQSFPLLLVNTDNNKEFADFQGILGFGYHCKDYPSKAVFNILEVLLKYSSNNLNLFYFHLNAENDAGWFQIGLMPFGYDIYSQYYRTVKIDTQVTNGQWKIQFDSMYFEDGRFIKLNDKISIGIGGALLSVKKQIFIEVVDKYFRELIISKECQMNLEKVYEVVCDETTIPPHIGDLTFIVGKWSFKVNAQKLFLNIPRKKKRILWFAMVHYPKQDEFYLSQLFLKGISVVYDRGNTQLGMFKQWTKE